MMLRLLMIIFGVVINTAVFATIQTQIDKTSIATDEMVTLTITSTDHLSLSPDLDPLKNEFYVVGTSQNSSINIVNGSTNIETQWQIGLMPKHEGELQIPVLTVGKERTTVQLVHVSKAGTANMLPVTTNSDIYLESSVTPKEAFIQEQFVYTVKLYFSRSIGNAYLMAPDMPDAKVTQNGQDIIYAITKKGRYFRVLERSYLITPEKTGQFSIQPPVLKGYLETTNDRYDLYGLGSHAVKPIKVVGQVQTVTVKPKPSNFVGHWLPAKKVTIQEEWEPANPVFHEGDPVTRKIEVTALGATGEQIPDIKVEQTTNVNTYSQPAKRDTDTDNGQQLGRLKQNIVYIPTTHGKQTLPAIKMKWWNSATKKEETATLPAKTIRVLPAAAVVQAVNVAPATTGTSTTPAQPQATVTPHKASWSSLIWPLIALAAIALWLATLWLWRKQASGGQSISTKKPHSVKMVSAHLKTACLQNYAKDTRKIFLHWAELHWPDHQIHNLADVVPILEKEQAGRLIQQIMQLEANFYGNHLEKWQGEEFWQAFEEYQTQHAVHRKAQDDPLPPLYCNES